MKTIIRFAALTLFLGLSLSVTVTAHAQQFAYVTNSNSDNVSVINTATNTVDSTVAVGSGPIGVAITPDGASAYVVNFNSDNVSVINTATNTVDATVAVGINGISPFDVAITPDGAFAYVVNFNSDNVSVINTATNTVDATVAVGSGPIGVAITPDGAFAYVVNNGLQNVSVINTATNTVDATVAVGSGPIGVAITPDGAFAYVTSVVSENVSVINTATNTVDATVAVGSGPFAVAITPDGAFVYVTNTNSDNVSVINTATNSVDATVAVGSRPRGVAITPDGAFAYVVNRDLQNVSVINTATDSVDATVAVGFSPQFVAIKPATPPPIASYLLDANFNDELGGPNVIVPNGGTLESGGYSFGPNQGLSLSDVLDADTYSIEILFRVDDTAGGGITTKFIDFANLTEDAGWYTGSDPSSGLNGRLAYSGAGLVAGPTVVFENDQLIQIVVTRDGSSNEMVGYANRVEQVRFTDDLVEGDFSGPGNVAQFFMDDVISGQVEVSGGFVDYINIYGRPLTPAEVAELVPDADGDGIDDAIDTQSSVFSNDFSDGVTFGSVVDRSDLALQITDHPDSLQGVILTATGGTGTARFQMCSDPVTDIFLTDGDQLIATCGSFIGETLVGEAVVTIGNITVTIPAGAVAFLEELPGSGLSVTSISGSIVVNYGGTDITVTPEDVPEIIPDEDNDGVPNDDDVCLATAIPESAPTSGLNKNRWTLQDVNRVFTQASPQEGSKNSFTTTDTRGCSCEQIVDVLDLGQGHLKNGCSTGVMLNWINTQ